MVRIILKEVLHCSLLKASSPLHITESPIEMRTFFSRLVITFDPSEFVPKESQADKSIIFYLVLEPVTSPEHFNASVIPFY